VLGLPAAVGSAIAFHAGQGAPWAP